MTEENHLRARGSLIDALSSALDRGNHGLQNVPGLLKRILTDGSWQEFETARGEQVTYERFQDFVTTPPLKGIGASIDLIKRIVGTDDPELLVLLRDAMRAKQGRPGSGETRADSARVSGTSGEDAALTADRLAREAPEEYAAVLRGERTLHAAAVRAGIRHRRIAIRLDNAESAAETLRKHMTHEQLMALIKLLAE